MKSTLHKLLLAGIVVLLSVHPAALLFSQSTGSIRGTVSDPTASIVPEASVVVVNTATGLSRTGETNGEGLFVFPDLPIGSYTLQIAKSGFQTEKREAINLLTGQILGLNITLTIGSQSQSVTVSADTQQIQTTTSTVSTSVDQKQMQDLPLNGRNPLQLTSLTPGAVLTNTGTESGQQDNTGLAVNGLRATQNNYQLDGALYVNRFFDSVPILPDPDALQEFTIQAANFSAEYAGAGALVQLSTRSGGNKIHGSAFEFLRNTSLNARNYFQQTVPPFKLNQFGGTVGGPIIKDRTFFFFSAEDMQQRSSPNPISIQVPTAAELKGDFSALLAQGIAIYNPTTSTPYAGNIIPTAIDPLSGAVAKNYLTPLASNPTTGIFNSTSNSNIDRTQYLVKVDHAVSSNNHFSTRYFYVQDNFQRPFNAPLGFFAANLFRNQSLTLSDTHIFSNTLTATVYASAGRFARTQIPEAPGLQSLQDLGQNVPLGTNVPIFPGIRANISGFVDVFSGGALTQDPTSFEYKAQIVKVLGAHTFSFGGSFERTRINANDYSYVPGDNTFNGQRTAAPAGATLPTGTTKSGSALADFYLGLDSQFFQDNGRKFYLRENRPALYVQDDWKWTKNLTVNGGLRWDPWLPPIDLNETLVGFEPGVQSTIAPGAPLGLVFNGDAGIQPSIFRKNYTDFAPRIGFAYNVAGEGKTVVRGAYGLFYGFPEGLLYQRTDAAQPINLYLNIVNPPAWDDIYAGYPGGDPFPRAHVSTDQFATYKFLLPFSGGVLNPKSKVGYTQDYNLTVEQQFGSNLAMSLAYVGNHALHIMGSRQFNPSIYAPGATAGNETARKLYPGLGAVEIADSYEYAIFNSLQLNVTRRVSHGLTLLSNVVWSKTIDNTSSATEGNTGPPNPLNLNSARGPADFDQNVRFNASANYQLPKFNVNKFTGAIVNGWQANAIISLQTGLPFTVLSGTDRSLSGIGNDYADVVPGVNPSRPAGYTRIQKYFNTAAFTSAALGTFGDVHRNSLRGPGYEDVDASLFKDVFNQSRIHGQFRAEVFNALNHTNLSNPVSTVSSGTYGQITSSGSPRVFQFGAKILF
ncbi:MULTISPECIES: carboxypeptidase-like regulatory domain-containing protein [Acidobacteriaceae]|uniref:TonB-dependent receptor n=1 Tax=Acidobacteriaceae TaxID=204434 RepID=UPI00131BE9B8|nr:MULTISPECIES: carboxypeptidase-like regulatory domain-containing protein [Acidobacteriaceae]MDW5266230.1 TonB-dependent receptor [Edaphobacter sp.]